MNKIISFLSVTIALCLFVDCNSNQNSQSNSQDQNQTKEVSAEESINKLIEVVGFTYYGGDAFVGSLSGDCSIIMTGTPACYMKAGGIAANVRYQVESLVLGYSNGDNETGKLVGIGFNGSGLFDTKQITADWVVETGGSRGARFEIALINGVKDLPVLFVGIKSAAGGNFEYRVNIDLNNEQLEKVVNILKGNVELMKQAKAIEAAPENEEVQSKMVVIEDEDGYTNGSQEANTTEASKSLRAAPEKKEIQKNMFVIEDEDGYTNVRQEANSTSEVLFELYENEKFEVIERVGSWCRIQYKGRTGFVHSSRVKAIRDGKRSRE